MPVRLLNSAHRPRLCISGHPRVIALAILRGVIAKSRLTPPVVALFNASDDTVDMVQRMLAAAGLHCLVGCRFADLKKGIVNFAGYLRQHDPDVVIFDISPPYQQNWAFFATFRDDLAMQGRGLVLTTTNKDRLDEVAGQDSCAIEVVGKPYDLDQIMTAVIAALAQARLQAAS